DTSQIERRKYQCEARTVGPFEKKATASCCLGDRGIGLRQNDVGRQLEEGALRLFKWSLSSRSFGAYLFQSPGIKLQASTYERRCISLAHFSSRLTKLIRNRLAKIFLSCAPGLEAGFELEELGRDR